MPTQLYPDLSPFYRCSYTEQNVSVDNKRRLRQRQESRSKPSLLQDIRSRVTGTTAKTASRNSHHRERERSRPSSRRDEPVSHMRGDIYFSAHHCPMIPSAPPEETVLERDLSTISHYMPLFFGVNDNAAYNEDVFDEPIADYTTDTTFCVESCDTTSNNNLSEDAINAIVSQDKILNTALNNLNLNTQASKVPYSKNVDLSKSGTPQGTISSLDANVTGVTSTDQPQCGLRMSRIKRTELNNPFNNPISNSVTSRHSTVIQIPSKSNPSTSNVVSHNVVQCSPHHGRTSGVIDLFRKRRPVGHRTVDYVNDDFVHVAPLVDTPGTTLERHGDVFERNKEPSVVAHSPDGYQSWVKWRKEMNCHLSGMILLRPHRAQELQQFRQVAEKQPSRTSMDRVFQNAKQNENTRLKEKTYIMYGIPRVKV